MYAGAVGAGLSREPMYPISNIVPVEFVRMPGGNDGGSRSFRPMPIIKPINMQLSGVGVRKIRVTGNTTGAPIPIIVKETARSKNNATTSAASAILNSER